MAQRAGRLGWWGGFIPQLSYLPSFKELLHYQLPLLPPISISLRGSGCSVIGLGFWQPSWQSLLVSIPPFSFPPPPFLWAPLCQPLPLHLQGVEHVIRSMLVILWAVLSSVELPPLLHLLCPPLLLLDNQQHTMAMSTLYPLIWL